MTYPNSSSLASEWEVSSKTIQRDLDYMRTMLDAPIAYNAKKRGYYYTEENFHLPAMALNDSDLFAIFIAEKVLKQYENTPVYARLTSVFTKISESLPEKVSVDPAQLDDKFSFFQSPYTVISESVWETVFSSLRTSTSVKIVHTKPGAENRTERVIDPYHIFSFHEEWYVIAFCHQKKGIRTFAFSRISQAKLTHHFYTVVEDFDLKQTTRSRFGVQWSEDEFEVKIWFSPDAAPYIKERQWQKGQKISEHEDKSIIMVFPVSHLLEVKRWVLSWGSQARVLAPNELIVLVKEELQQALDYY